MTQQIPRTSGDVIVDNLEYLSDLVSDILTTIDRTRKLLPAREEIRDLAFSEDIGQVNELNRVMADTAIAVWAAERTKDIVTNVFNDLSPDEM